MLMSDDGVFKLLKASLPCFFLVQGADERLVVAAFSRKMSSCFLKEMLAPGALTIVRFRSETTQTYCKKKSIVIHTNAS